MFQEVVVNGIFIPTIDLLSDPDYINQYIAWMVSHLIIIYFIFANKMVYGKNAPKFHHVLCH